MTYELWLKLSSHNKSFDILLITGLGSENGFCTDQLHWDPVFIIFLMCLDLAVIGPDTSSFGLWPTCCCTCLPLHQVFQSRAKEDMKDVTVNNVACKHWDCGWNISSHWFFLHFVFQMHLFTGFFFFPLACLCEHVRCCLWFMCVRRSGRAPHFLRRCL